MESKFCFTCKTEKPVSEFYKSNVKYYSSACKICNKERKNSWSKTDEGKLSATKTKLKQRFGITLEEYETLLTLQNNQCLLCGTSKCDSGHKLSIDHCHKTGKIRGLLCKACNVGLGNFKDNQEALAKAIEYLKKWES